MIGHALRNSELKETAMRTGEFEYPPCWPRGVEPRIRDDFFPEIEPPKQASAGSSGHGQPPRGYGGGESQAYRTPSGPAPATTPAAVPAAAANPATDFAKEATNLHTLKTLGILDDQEYTVEMQKLKTKYRIGVPAAQ